MQNVLHSFLFCFCALALAGCDQTQKPPESSGGAAPQAATAVVDKNTAGSVSGTISFKGAAPKMPMLDMSSDPACPGDPQAPDVVVVKNGKLANVFVYVKDADRLGTFAAPAEEVVMDQKRCHYTPHVLGLMVGQPLRILNTDTAEHNVHPMPKNNAAWNESQAPKGKPIMKTFQQAELMMPVQCNQHPWMKMYVNVLAHPFFAVSADDGSFQVRDLPPGGYTLVAVHEKYGEQTMKITVASKQNTAADFVFSLKSK
ncbi:MAG TPA: carboxypeptidase regulatory-like domain-containing protein [Candidatus Angelobacter sp.]